MMDIAPVLLSRDGHIARLTLNRPEQLNALSPDLIQMALALVSEVAESDARVLVLSGAGKSFSAGVDLKSVSAPGYDKAQAAAFSDNARVLGALLGTMPQATIACITGHCFTGGLELALACDLLVASDDAVFCDTHAKLGIRPGWGLSQRLPAAVGVQRAREMSFTARRVSADEAVRIGLILEHHPRDELEARVSELAEQIARADPSSINAYKTLYRASQNLGIDDGLAFEAGYRPRRIGNAERQPLSVHLKSS